MDLMIDLETLGLKNNTVVTQIGWALFSAEGGPIMDSGVYYLDPDDQIKRGRVMDWSTIAWWLLQDQSPREIMAKSKERAQFSVTETLGEFINLREWKDLKVWGHGATFDISILTDLLETYCYKAPWDFRDIRDTRTLFDLRPDDKLPKSSSSHAAQVDACVQAEHVQKIRHSLLNDTGH